MQPPYIPLNKSGICADCKKQRKLLGPSTGVGPKICDKCLQLRQAKMAKLKAGGT